MHFLDSTEKYCKFYIFRNVFTEQYFGNIHAILLRFGGDRKEQQNIEPSL